MTPWEPRGLCEVLLRSDWASSPEGCFVAENSDGDVISKWDVVDICFGGCFGRSRSRHFGRSEPGCSNEPKPESCLILILKLVPAKQNNNCYRQEILFQPRPPPQILRTLCSPVSLQVIAARSLWGRLRLSPPTT